MVFHSHQPGLLGFAAASWMVRDEVRPCLFILRGGGLCYSEAQLGMKQNCELAFLCGVNILRVYSSLLVGVWTSTGRPLRWSANMRNHEHVAIGSVIVLAKALVIVLAAMLAL